MPVLYFTDEETEAQGGALTCSGSQKGVTLHRSASYLYYEGNTTHGSNPSMYFRSILFRVSTIISVNASFHILSTETTCLCSS